MNRFEMLMLALILFGAFLIMLKSKWFDRCIDSILKGSKSTTAQDLADEKNRLQKNRENLENDLDKQENQVKMERENLKKL